MTQLILPSSPGALPLEGDRFINDREPAAPATKILLIEDSAVDRLLLKQTLSDELALNIEVESVERLTDGLELLGCRRFDLALLDLDLPDSNGLATIERLRREAPDLPIIVLTGRIDPKLEGQALRLGAQDYLVKGELAVRMLGEIIGNAIDRQTFRAAQHRYVRDLAASEARVRAIIDANADALVIADLQGTVRFVNPAAVKWFGRAADTLLGNPLGFPIDTDRISEVEVVRGEGDAGHAELRVVEIQWDGECALLLSLRDITERKRAEAALRASEADFRILSDAVPHIVWTARADSWTVYLNERWMDYTGITVEEGLGSGWQKPFHPDDQQRMMTAWQRAIADQDTYSVECRLCRADGAYRWWLLKGVPIRDAGGEITKWVGTCTDIHDLKVAEFQISRINGELQRQHCELQTLFNLVPAMIWVKDTENNVLRVNQRVADVAGRKAEDIEGRSMFEIYPREAAEYYAADRLVIDSGMPKLGIIERLQDGQGNDTWVQTDKVPYYDENGKIIGVVVMAQDITQRKRDQDELQELNARLEDRVRIRTAELHLARDEAVEANRAKSDFLATMSHEIRTPMNGVIAMIEVLTHTDLNQHQVEMIDLIRNSAFSLLGIVDNILDLSKIEAGKLMVENRPMHLCETLDTVCAMLIHLARQRRVDLTLFADPAIPHTLLGDAGRLRQLLVNLVGNAIKFSAGREQPGHVSVRAVLRGRQANQVSVDLVVADDGIGMDEATLAKLFQPFSQADLSTTRRFGGSGLGLAICGKLVQLMNGAVTVQSVPDHGSTFTVRLDLAVPEDGGELEPAGALDGLRCRIVGADVPLAEDLGAYLAHSNVIVERSPDLASATAAEPHPGLSLWLVLPGPTVPAIGDLRALAPRLPGAETRFIVLHRGMGSGPHLHAYDLVVAEAELLSCRMLLLAVALVSGRSRSESAARRSDSLLTIHAPDRAEARSQGRLILVAEDNETNREVILRQLRLIGYAADVACDGSDALQLWRNGDYALLLTDLHMPLMDGYALAASIRAEEVKGTGRRLPIIALTANALLDEERRCRAAGMDAYLTKPVRLASLKTAIEAWLGAAEVSAPLSLLGNASVAAAEAATPEAVTPALDLSVLRAMIGDDPANIDDVLRSFRSSAEASSVKLTEAVAADSGQVVSDAAHKLKSAARSVGALRLGELCALIEDAAGAKGSQELQSLLPLFRAESAEVFRFLDARLAVTAMSP